MYAEPAAADRIRSRTWSGVAALAMSVLTCATPACAENGKLFTHQSYVEDTMRVTNVPLGNLKNMFGWVLGQLPERVKVYPTENYYYFRFMHNGVNYAGNIRLDASDRDRGRVHFAYFEDMQEYREQPLMLYRVFDKSAGVKVEKVENLLYRITYKDKSVLFELNDLSKVTPPPGTITAEEIYIGPVFDDSAIRFFLIFNARLKIFHYVLDETVRVNEEFLSAAQSDRILVGKRTGFAFYRDEKIERKILIGVFDGNARVNNYFDGPFDQLPDNFIAGDVLQKAMIEAEPSLEGRINRYGHFSDGSGRVSISPYTYYRTEAELLPFSTCTHDTNVPAENYYACFSVDWNGTPMLSAYKRMTAAPAQEQAPASTPSAN